LHTVRAGRPTVGGLSLMVKVVFAELVMVRFLIVSHQMEIQ